MIGPEFNIHNAQAVELAHVENLAFDEFREAILQAVEDDARVSALFGAPVAQPFLAAKDSPGGEGDAGTKESQAGMPELPLRLYAVLTRDAQGAMAVLSCDVGPSFPLLTNDCPQVHLFEREIAEQWSVLPVGHPWFKPVRFQRPYVRGTGILPVRPTGVPPVEEQGRDGPATHGRDAHATTVIGRTEFFQVAGEEGHEVAVGPVHAGIIEPGHFRFQCSGERVHHLEISLGYQHRGVERAMLRGAGARGAIHYMETLAGDTTIGHATAYCQAIEALRRASAPPRALAIRGIALELERLANHIGDLGALAGDVGFLPTASYCGRIRGDALNMTALICGNRFGRNLVRPGGTAFDLDGPLTADLQDRLDALEKDTAVAVNLLWDTPSVMARFEDTGPVSADDARAIALVGPAARACGIDRDVRRDLPFGIFCFSHIPVGTWNTGDVFARSYVRWLEVQRSIKFIREQLDSLPAGPVKATVQEMAPNSLVVSMTEGWRGEICHVALTDPRGQIQRYKVVDPSFHNWFALALALRGQEISDFPLCNKSFNLSYCGHDL